MSKTYRSMFLACGACKLQVDSDARCCKHCGKIIWLKDASDAIVSAPVEIAKSVTANTDRTEDDPKRRKLQTVLKRWLPTVFPDQYYVAPASMPKETLEFLVQHMGKEFTYGVNILGYGYDSVNKRIFVFDDNAMYYQTVVGNAIHYKIEYSCIEELEFGNEQLFIKTKSIGIKSFAVLREGDFAEMLFQISGAKQKLYSGSMNIAKVGISTQCGEEQRIVSNLPADGPMATLEKKTSYTLKDYIREETNGTMWLVMLATKGCLGIQGYVSIFLGAPALAVFFVFFALAIAFHRLWVNSICWIYCVVILQTLGVASEFGGWYGLTGILLTLIILYRVFIGRKYKEYMANKRR